MEAVVSSQIAGVKGAAASRSKAAALPWYCLAVVFGATCIPIGALWDISWHSTIGRDTFWTPAHVTIHLGGVIPGFTAGWLALRATFFGTKEDKEAAVSLGPFRAPLGAWVIICGAFAMLLSAPFDDWWHNAYGLDVEILSPPHTVLAAGMYAVAVGALLLVLSFQNRTGAKSGSVLFTYTAGVLITMATIILTEKSYPNQQRGMLFYQLSSATFPLYLVAVARAAKVRWAATRAAAVYMTIMLLMIWVLPLFKAQPMLAPIYNPVDRMVPPSFPLLLVVPALVIDLLIERFGQPAKLWRDWLLAAALGGAFLVLLMAVQYPIAGFLLSERADNSVFAGNRWLPYFIKPGPWQHRFWNLDNGRDVMTVAGVVLAFLIATVKSRIALAAGAWMARVQR